MYAWWRTGVRRPCLWPEISPSVKLSPSNSNSNSIHVSVHAKKAPHIVRAKNQTITRTTVAFILALCHTCQRHDTRSCEKTCVFVDSGFPLGHVQANIFPSSWEEFAFCFLCLVREDQRNRQSRSYCNFVLWIQCFVMAPTKWGAHDHGKVLHLWAIMRVI